ncbi:hypothetical protein GRF59_15020 [Paenibacillus sp. HJL G12]|uniref:Uncharacterized protein n=1 Tax=Paenibacillus dendrobii TaxID=2691084 RepID=A0A7X3LHA0_9BACL|nr:hypothetical protein [Paenibacillus dendrobii]MWV44932.1 hypothetical protein [Paenibacillus dendrobii]
MTVAEMYAEAKEIYVANENEFYFIGLRFENKERAIGEECEYSRHNADREDEREFPKYGTEEYEEMELLNGTSAWDMSISQTYEYSSFAAEKARDQIFGTDHCYIIASKRLGRHDDPDHGEIVIKDALVIAQLF